MRRLQTAMLCVALLAVCSLAAGDRIPIPAGYPNASTTGYSGTLTSSGAITVTVAGTTLQNLNISGGVQVKANNVTIRNCRITGGLYGINASFGYTGLLIEDCTIYDGTSKGIYGGNFTARRCDISYYSDCMLINSNVLIEDCYLHDLKFTDGSHNDGVQSTGGSNVVIRHCTVQAQYQGQTSAFIFQTNNGPIDNVLFDNNFLSGGTYTVYIKDKLTGYGAPTNVTVQYNMWEYDSYQFGHISYNGSPTFTCNIFHTGDPIPQNPACGGGNQAPVANAGPDQNVFDVDESGSESVSLNGSASYDTDGSIVSYVWKESTTQIATGATPSVTMNVGSHTVTLTVTDDDAATDTDTVVIDVLDPGAINSSSSWQSFAIAAQTGAFTFELDVTPNAANMDGLVGVCNAAAAAYTDLACIVRFNTSGNMDARDGGAFTADVTAGYSAATEYHVRMEIDISTHTYDVYVTPDGGSQITLATGYDFRTEQAGLSSLNYWALIHASGSLSVDNVTVTAGGGGENSAPTANAGSDQSVTDYDDSGNEQVTLNGTGSSDSDGTIVSYVWTESSTQIATGSGPSVLLSVAVHTITLTVTDDDDATDTDTVSITVNAAPANVAPTANAGPDQTVTDTDDGGDESVTLDGSASSDSDGTIASYVWKEDTTQIATGSGPSVTLDVGEHTIVLTVTDNDSATDDDTVVITVNAPGGETDEIAFDAVSSNSIDGDGTSLSWSHTIGSGDNRVLVVGVGAEDGSTADMTISSVKYNNVNMTAVSNSQTTAGAGTRTRTELFYMLEDDLPSSGSYTVAVTYSGNVLRRSAGAISLENAAQEAPEAVATWNSGSVTASSVSTNITTQTDGAWVVDVVGMGASGSWTATATNQTERWDRSPGGAAHAGSTKPVASAGSATMSWTPTATHLIAHSLAAFAPSASSAPPNEAPTADAGSDQTVTDADESGSETVTLDGSGSSDSDGTISSYIWRENSTQIASGVSPMVSLSTATHTIELTVVDDDSASDTDTVSITVNDPPTANAGSDQTVTDTDSNGSQAVTLNGSGSSDSDGSIVSYVWKESDTQIATGSGPQVTLDVGTHTIELTVVDDDGASDTDSVEITVNDPPVADAGLDQTVTDTDENGSESVTLDGTDSTDSDGTISSYVWKEDTTQIATGSEPNVVLNVGSHTITLTVTDNDSATDTDTVVVDVVVPNTAPTVDAGSDDTIGMPTTQVSLDGTVSDDGLPDPPAEVTTTWSKFSGPGTVTFGNASNVDTTASFSTTGVYVLELLADDGDLSTTDTVQITFNHAAPSVDAGSDDTITLGDGATLDGTVSDDGMPDPPGAVTTTWSKVSGPGVASFANAAAVDTTVTFNATGEYVLRLTGDDGDKTASDDVTITVDAPTGGGDIAFDAASSTKSTGAGTTLSWSHTIGSGDDRALVVGVGAEDGSTADMTISSVTYDSVALTAVSNSMTTAGAGTRTRAELFYMLEDDLPAGGSYTVTVTYSGTVDRRSAGAISLENVAQEAPEAVATYNSGTTTYTTVSTNITTITDGAWVIDVVGIGNSGSWTATATDQVERWDQSPTGATHAGSTKPVDSAGSTPMSWSFSGTAHLIAHSLAAFAPAASAPANTAPTADAGTDQTVTDTDGNGSASVTLDGSGSSDSDGSIVSYVWTESSTQIATGSGPSVTLDVGEYTITLEVTDDDNDTDTDTVDISVVSNTVTSTSSWQNSALPTQTWTCTIEFDMKANDADMSGVTAISGGSVAAFTDCAILVRFYTNGEIEARDGDVYGSDNTVTYNSGTWYHVRLVIDITNDEYSIYVTPSGQSEVTLGVDYSFRTAQIGVGSLDNWALIADLGGSHEVKNVTITD